MSFRQSTSNDAFAATVRRALLADPTYNWTSLRAGIGPMRACWRRYQDINLIPPAIIVGALGIFQRRFGAKWNLTDEEKSLSCWMLLDNMLDAPTCLQPSMTTAAVIPQGSEMQTESSSSSTNRDSHTVVPKRRKWSRHALSCRRLSSSVEIEVQVPVQVSQGEVQMLPTYLRTLLTHLESPEEGIACDIPSWAVEWLDLDFWTMEGLLAFVQEIARADRDLVDDSCGELVAERAESSGPVRKRVLKTATRWGRCEQCQLSLRPHIFKSGKRSGEAYFVCSGFFQKRPLNQRRCWWAKKVPLEEWHNLPKRLKNEHASLKAALQRNSRSR